MPVDIPVHFQGEVLGVVVTVVAVCMATAIGFGIQYRIIGLHIQNRTIALQLQNIAQSRWQQRHHTPYGAEIREDRIVENVAVGATREQENIGVRGIVADDFRLAADHIKAADLQLEHGGEIVAGVPAQFQPVGRLVALCFVPVQYLVFDKPVDLPLAHGKAQTEFVREGAGCDKVDDALIELRFIATLNKEFPVLTGRGGADIDGPGDAVFPQQNILWSAQYLHPFKVQKGGPSELRAAVVNAVHIHAHRLLEALVFAGADTANINIGADAGFGHGEVGNIGLKILDLGEPGFHHFFTADCADRDRHILKTLFAQLCGHDHFFQLRGDQQWAVGDAEGQYAPKAGSFYHYCFSIFTGAQVNDPRYGVGDAMQRRGWRVA